MTAPDTRPTARGEEEKRSVGERRWPEDFIERCFCNDENPEFGGHLRGSDVCSLVWDEKVGWKRK